MALDELRHTASSDRHAAPQHNGHDQPSSALSDLEAAASAALENAEQFVRQNPLLALAGVSAAGALLAVAISRRAQPTPLDQRLLNEFNRHSEDIVRSVRRNANSLAGSDTVSAIESIVSTIVAQLAKVPESVSRQVSNLTK